MLTSGRVIFLVRHSHLTKRALESSLLSTRQTQPRFMRIPGTLGHQSHGISDLAAGNLKTNVTHSKSIHVTSARAMFIQVEETPNPNSLKFYPGECVLESGTVDFHDKVQASMKSPLAKALFRIKGVKSVFFAHDFITVSKEDDEKIEWNVLKPQIFSEIMIFYTMKQPILYSSPDNDPNLVTEHDSPVVREIKELIMDKIRPTIQEDGGDLEFVSYEDSILKVRLRGACTSCPSSVVTLKNGIRNMLQYYVPEVQDVEQVTDDFD